MDFTKTCKYDINGIRVVRKKKNSELVIEGHVRKHVSKKKKKRNSSLLDGKNCIINKVYTHNHNINVQESGCMVCCKNSLDGINSSNVAKENINDENNTMKHTETPLKELEPKSSKLRSIYRIKESSGDNINLKIITEKVIDKCYNVADKESNTLNETSNTSEKKCLNESNIKSTETDNENDIIKSVEQINPSTTTAEYSTIRESLNTEQISGNRINLMRRPLRTTDFSTFSCENIQERINSMEVNSTSDTDSNQSHESSQNKIGEKTKSITHINVRGSKSPTMNESVSTTAEHSRLNQTNSNPRESWHKNLQNSSNELISKNGIDLRKTLELSDSSPLNHENTQENISTTDVDYESETTRDADYESEMNSNQRYKASENENREKAISKTSIIKFASSSSVNNISKSRTSPEHCSTINSSNSNGELLLKQFSLLTTSFGITKAETKQKHKHLVTIDLSSDTDSSETHEFVQYKKSKKTTPRTPVNRYGSFPLPFKCSNRKQKVCKKIESFCEQINKSPQKTDNQIQTIILQTLTCKSPSQTSELPMENNFNSPKSKQLCTINITEDTNETSYRYQNGQSNVPSQVPYRILSSSQLLLNPEDPVISKLRQTVSNRDSIIHSQKAVIMNQYENKQKYVQSSNLSVGTQYPMNSRQNYYDDPQLRRTLSPNSSSIQQVEHSEARSYSGEQTSKITSGGYLDNRLRYTPNTYITRRFREQIRTPRYPAIRKLKSAINKLPQPDLGNSNQHFCQSESGFQTTNFGQTSKTSGGYLDKRLRYTPNTNVRRVFRKQTSRYHGDQNLAALINRPSQPDLDILKQNLCKTKSGCIQNFGQISKSDSTQPFETVINTPQKSIFSITQPTTIWHPTGLKNPKAIPILLIPIAKPVESQGLEK